MRRLLGELGAKLDSIGRSLDPPQIVTSSLIFDKAMRDVLGRNYKPLQEMPRILLKKEHPGSFVIPCTLGHFNLEDALCDSGACVNIISLEMVKNMGIGPIQHCSLPIMFGDASVRKPEGVLVDFPIVVEGCVVPSDVIVMNMVDERRQPLILGGPFLASVGARMDYESMTVVLTRISKTTSYPIEPCYNSMVMMILGEPPGPIDKDAKDNDGVRIVEIEDEELKDDKIGDAKLVDKGESQDEKDKNDDIVGDHSVVSEEVTLKHTKVGAYVKELEDTKIGDGVIVEEKKEPPGTMIKIKEFEDTKIKDGVEEKWTIHPMCSIVEVFPKIIFKPLTLTQNTLECGVSCKGGPKPFHKAKFTIPKELKGEEFHQAKRNMERRFNFKMDEWKPFDEDGASNDD